jgi:transposase
MLQLHLRQIESVEQAVADLEGHIAQTLGPFRAAVNLLITMPGLSTTAATVIVAEIGTDMGVFPTASHLVSWAGLCPRLDESAGKGRSTRTRPSAPWLKPTLVQAAWAATHKKDSHFHAQFLRLKSRRGPKKAILAVAASMLTDVYFMLRDGVEFDDLGSQYFVERDKEHLTKRLLSPPA